MQFTLKKIEETENGKEIVGLNFEGKEVRYPYKSTEDLETINKLQNCQVIFIDGKITGAWDNQGKPIYSAQGHSIGHDSVR